MSAYTVEEFNTELRSQLAGAGERLLSYVDVNAGELHRRLGGDPGPDRRIRNRCRAMHAVMRGADEVRSEPLSGAGASLTSRYRLPR